MIFLLYRVTKSTLTNVLYNCKITLQPLYSVPWLMKASVPKAFFILSTCDAIFRGLCTCDNEIFAMDWLNSLALVGLKSMCLQFDWSMVMCRLHNWLWCAGCRTLLEEGHCEVNTKSWSFSVCCTDDAQILLAMWKQCKSYHLCMWSWMIPALIRRWWKC